MRAFLSRWSLAAWLFWYWTSNSRAAVLLREEAGAGDRVEFLTRRRAELQERMAQITAAVTVLDDKIAYYSAP